MGEPIKKVWIEEGCISCRVCEDLAPQVFQIVDDQPCVLRPDAAAHFAAAADDIAEAARDCPVEVIKIEREGGA